MSVCLLWARPKVLAHVFSTVRVEDGVRVCLGGPHLNWTLLFCQVEVYLSVLCCPGTLPRGLVCRWFWLLLFRFSRGIRGALFLPASPNLIAVNQDWRAWLRAVSGPRSSQGARASLLSLVGLMLLGRWAWWRTHSLCQMPPGASMGQSACSLVQAVKRSGCNQAGAGLGSNANSTAARMC